MLYLLANQLHTRIGPIHSRESSHRLHFKGKCALVAVEVALDYLAHVELLDAIGVLDAESN